jgi:3-phenylpropionate/trans-cinnamate dioxygenase ferredoxin reductase subunit
MRLVIVGGGPAAFAAARGYRDASGDGDVTILTPELTPPYTRPALSKEFLRGELTDDDVPIEPAAWYEQHKIGLRLGTEAETLDPAQRTVTLAGGETLRYDACVLATGAEPKPLPVPGATEEWVLLLRSLATARVLRDRAANATSAIVTGSGFIGCEAAASLAMRGLKTTLVTDEGIPHETRLGEAAGHRIQAWLEELGVELVLGGGVETIGDHAVHVPAHEPIRGDLILMAAGVAPCAGLASDAGLEVADGRVKTDARMRTSDEHVYAAGDVAFAYNAAAQRHLAVEHWGEALNMGEVAGRAIAGEDAQWDVAPGFWSTIGEHTLKYVAWGDGYDESHLVEHGGGAFTVWYAQQGTTVGVLTHEADEDYERGRVLIEAKAALP